VVSAAPASALDDCELMNNRWAGALLLYELFGFRGFQQMAHQAADIWENSGCCSSC